MLPNIYLIFGVVGTACWGNAAATLTGPACRTPAMHPEAKQESRVAMAQNAANAIQARMSGDIIQIPTYFHVVAKSKSVQDGYLSVRSLSPYNPFPRKKWKKQSRKLMISPVGVAESAERDNDETG